MPGSRPLATWRASDGVSTSCKACVRLERMRRHASTRAPDRRLMISPDTRQLHSAGRGAGEGGARRRRRQNNPKTTLVWVPPDSDISGMKEFAVRPNPADPLLTERVSGIDQDGKPIETAVPVERPLTLFLNGREIVTMMTVGDYPDCLAVGYLLNQNMLQPDDRVTAIDVDLDSEAVGVRTEHQTDFEDKLKKKTLTSGSAQGTVFGDVMKRCDAAGLNPAAVVHTSWLYALWKKINTTPSLYLEAGAIHGCVLCEGDRP